MASVPRDSVLQEFAERIDTGNDNPDRSRALIIFNFSDKPLEGLVLFSVDMPWTDTDELPPVRVCKFGSEEAAPSGIRQLKHEPAAPGQAKGRISFGLCFEVDLVGEHSYATYIAEYVESQDVPEVIGEPADSQYYRVVETVRHEGELPPFGPLPELFG